MKIKTKLTMNTIITLLTIAIVSATSITGMGFVKSKLFYLMQRSTPFQIKTIEFQRTIQQATSNLIKISVARDIKEFRALKGEAEGALAQVRTIQQELEALGSDKNIEAHAELERIGVELFSITESRINAEVEAATANNELSKKLDESSRKLKDLDTKIAALQSKRSSAFVTSLDDAKGITVKLRNIEVLKIAFKDLQLALFELQKTQDKKETLIARGKVQSAINKMLNNEHPKQSVSLLADIKAMGDKASSLVTLKTAYLGAPAEDKKAAYDAANKDFSETVSALMLGVEQEAQSASDAYGFETAKQETDFMLATAATSVLVGNSEIVILGLSIEGLSERLFTLNTPAEIEATEREITATYAKIAPVKASLDKALIKLDAKAERQMLDASSRMLDEIKNILTSGNGIIFKIKNKVTMKQKALAATDRLRELVIRQASAGEKTVSSAQGEQEKAMKSVTRMVNMSISLIIGASVAAVLLGIFFGAWIYRSITRPLNDLIHGATEIADGNLTYKNESHGDDEIGTVQNSMGRMVDKLRDIVTNIKTTTQTVASHSGELSATATLVDRNSDEQDRQIELSAAAVIQMSQTNQDVTRNANATATAAQQMKDVALGGKKTMEVTVEKLNQFVGTFKEASSQVEYLGKRSEEINNIVTLIKAIADQTNLLALNAAIEAARAGDQGRGFAVVADEVRKLAERTTAATDDIATTVRSMQGDISQSVTFMQHERESVENVVGQVTNTMDSIDELVEFVGTVTDMVQRIAAATEQQSVTSDDISKNMESIAENTRQLKLSISEIMRASSDLSRITNDLNQLAGKFRVQ